MTLIAVDGREAYRTGRRGMGNVLVSTLRELTRQRPNWRFKVFHALAPPDDPFADCPSVSHHRIQIPASDRFDLWERVRLPLAASLSRADLLFCPANTGPGWTPCPRAVIAHDLIPLELEPDSPRTLSWLRKVGRAVNGAKVVFTASEHARRSLVRQFGLNPDRIELLGWSTDMRREFDPAKFQAVRQKYGLGPGESYAFGFAASDPRKNTRRLLEAFARVPTEVKLLLVGVQGPALEEFRQLADSRVLLHGYVDGADLPALLSGAQALCFPSRAEGFGLPILDAFACGTAVLASNRTSLPEVAGDAAVLVDPDSTESIQEGLARLLNDSGLRADLVAKGTERLRVYTWANTARVIVQAFERILQR